MVQSKEKKLKLQEVKKGNNWMNYWHIQMNQPFGRNNIKIDPMHMLQEAAPVIGTGDWDDEQCRNFTDEKGTGMKIGDIVMVRDGKDPIALCEVQSESFRDSILEAKYKNQNYRKVKVLSEQNYAVNNLLKEKLQKFNTSYIQASGTLTKCVNNNATTEFIKDWYKLYKKNEKMENLKIILQYKKQIILQGPPGTGKTRLAKKIAENLLGKKGIDDIDIKNWITAGSIIQSAKGAAQYLVKDIADRKVILERANGSIGETSFEKIIECFNEKWWENEIKDNDRRRTAAIAKFIYDKKDVTNNDQFKLIQFHPSYTYEDFVRGIVSKPNPEGDGIVYEAENKTLAAFAEAALANYKEATQKISVSPVADVFEDFIENVKDEMASDVNHKYPITDAVYLFAADETRFKYKGDNWVAHQKGLNMKFSELQQIIEANVTERQAIKKMTALEELTRQHATYFLKVAERFYEFKANYKVADNKSEITHLKNYVLIIDEINRANLSSVLGELIYALEYRGEEVESMYEVAGTKKLILPPNLYIIGTMNTADRSVGHIDYAIRRRFAFVDVLPEELEDNEEIYFNKNDFRLVANLFTDQNVSPEFEINAVQVGHSYFIVKKSEAQNEEERNKLFNFKMQYEVIPILEEYVRDGILLGKVGEQPILDYIRSLKKQV